MKKTLLMISVFTWLCMADTNTQKEVVESLDFNLQPVENTSGTVVENSQSANDKTHAGSGKESAIPIENIEIGQTFLDVEIENPEKPILIEFS